MATYREGSNYYTRNSDGSVTKSNPTTGYTRTVPAGHSDMKYIPTAAGGTRDGVPSSGGGSYGGSSSGSGPTASGGSSSSNKYSYSYTPKSSSYTSTSDWYKAANDRALSLLNPYNLPGTYIDGKPYEFVTVPQEGTSSSKDIIAPPTFEVTSSGNIIRKDYTQSGEVNTFIPNLGGYRQTADGRLDRDVGDAYSMQTSPYSFTTRFVRGDQIGTIPSWFTPGAHESWLDQALAVTRGEGEYGALLPGEDYYQPYYGGASGGGIASYSGGSSAPSLTPSVPSAEIAPRRERDPGWEGQFWGDIDIDAELLALGHNPAMYSDAQKQAILQAMRQLQGGR